jgi:hypothetical protein
LAGVSARAVRMTSGFVVGRCCVAVMVPNLVEAALAPTALALAGWAHLRL